MKTETVKHTPGPWHVAGLAEQIITMYPQMRGHAIVNRPEESEGDAEWEANAAFIVRACNAHEELLAAAEAAARRLDLEVCGDGTTPEELALLEIAAELRAAIAKAKPA